MTTPLSPPSALYKTVITAAETSVCAGEKSKRILPILIAAKHTEAIIIMLKKTPKYIALNPRNIAAPLPPYLTS